MELPLFIAAGAVGGWLAGRFMRGNDFGLIGDVLLGVVGGLAGGYLFRSVGDEIGGGLTGGVIVAFGGGALLLFTARLVTPRRSGRRV